MSPATAFAADDTVAPAAVRGMMVSSDKSRVKLDWTNSPEKDLAGYHVYRAITPDGTYTKLTATPKTGSDYADTAAPISLASYYRVTAVDKAGNESAPVSATGVRKDGVAPAVPTGLTVTRPVGAAGATLEWADNTEADLAGYVVSRATSSGGTYTKLTPTPIKQSTYEDTSAVAGTNYYYRVTAVDLGDYASKPAQVAAPVPDLTAPAAVRSVVATGSTSSIKLDWANNTEADLVGYHVYRAASEYGTYVKLTTTPRTSSDFTDGTAPGGLVSHYRITAVDKSGNESAPVSATATRRDTVAPGAPTELVANGTADGVALDWADNSEADLAGYVVSRATSANGTFTRLTATPITVSSYVDTAAPASGPAFYRVTAVDWSGNTSAAAAVNATRLDTTAPAAPTAVTATGTADGITLDWADSSEADLAGYLVFRSDAADGEFEQLTARPVTASTYVDTTAPTGGTAFYRVTAVDKTGNTSAAATADGARLDTTAPAAPAELTATGTVEDVTLDWVDNTETDLAGYVVARSDAPNGTFTRLTSEPLTASTFVDTSGPAGVVAYYQVTAVDDAGNASAVTTVEGTRLVEKSPVAGADVTVASDGSGDYTTIAAALAAAPANTATPWVIGIKPGTYREVLSLSRPNVTLLGATGNAADTVITYNNAALTPNASGTGTLGTTGSSTVQIRGNNVTVKNLTIENSYVETGSGSEQAVALKTQGDRLVFDNVRLLGDQDTLYVDSPGAGVLARSYFVNSYVEGDVDFIFGRGTAVFDRSTLHASSRGSTSNNGYITAPSTDKSLPYGILITDSTVTSDAPAGTFHLGRPWQPSGDANAIAQVVIRDTELPAAIKAAPWTDMTSTFSWRNARFFEYQNTGPGAAGNGDRPQLSATDAAKYTKWTYLAGSDNWNPTGQEAPPPPADTTAPAAPTGLAGTAGDSNVSLTWTANGDNDLAGYNVYRSTSSPVALTEANKLTSSPVSETTYTDRTAANGTAYTYAVTAVDDAGNESPASAEVPASPVGVALPAHDILVAADGTGQYSTVQAALNAAAVGTAAKPTVIAVKPGTYRELITLSKNYVTLIGTTGNAGDVVLTYDNAAGTTNPATGGIYGTGNSQSMLVSGNNATVRAVTVQNAFDEAAVVGAGGAPAGGRQKTGDRLIFDNVRLLGNQDTLLADTRNAYTVARSYYVNSYIEGDVDFIFGRGTAVFDRTTIHALSRGSSSNNGYITAASTADQNPYGFLIVESTITSNAPANSYHLGRPWRGWTDGTQVQNGVTYNSRGQVTIRNTTLPAAVKSTQPWTDMSPNLWTDGRFFEYQNTGAGTAVNATRPQLTDDQAGNYTKEKYLAGSDGWNPIL